MKLDAKLPRRGESPPGAVAEYPMEEGRVGEPKCLLTNKPYWIVLSRSKNMKTKLNLLVVVLLVVVTLAQPSTARAGGGLGLTFRGPSAIASFYNVSDCMVTEAFVITSQFEQRDAHGPATSLSFASVTVSQFDLCADTLVLYAYGTASPLSPGELQISRKLNTAQLTTTVPVFDEISGASFDLSVDMRWTAIGPLSRQQTTTHFHTPGCISNSHFQARSRPAEAAGTISDGAVNFTPEASISASLDSVKSGTVVIGCN